MRQTPTQYATYGCYILLGATWVVIAGCRLITWANYWMQQPSDRMKGWR